MSRSMWIDIVAIVAFAVMAIAGQLTGHDAALAITVVVVGRLKPPDDRSGGPGGGMPSNPNLGGIATIALALWAPISGLVHHVRAGRPPSPNVVAATGALAPPKGTRT